MNTKTLTALIAGLLMLSFCPDNIRNRHIRAYVQKHAATAVVLSEKYGVPAAIILAQAGIESGWGRSELARRHNNHFGIKCHKWDGERAYRKDDKIINGRLVESCFRSYPSICDSFQDHSLFLTSQPTKYRDAIGCDWRYWVEVLVRDGYASSSDYGALMEKIIIQNKLNLI